MCFMCLCASKVVKKKHHNNGIRTSTQRDELLVSTPLNKKVVKLDHFPNFQSDYIPQKK